jgi:hypothetical protein
MKKFELTVLGGKYMRTGKSHSPKIAKIKIPQISSKESSKPGSPQNK